MIIDLLYMALSLLLLVILIARKSYIKEIEDLRGSILLRDTATNNLSMQITSLENLVETLRTENKNLYDAHIRGRRERETSGTAASNIPTARNMPPDFLTRQLVLENIASVVEAQRTGASSPFKDVRSDIKKAADKINGRLLLRRKGGDDNLSK